MMSNLDALPTAAVEGHCPAVVDLGRSERRIKAAPFPRQKSLRLSGVRLRRQPQYRPRRCPHPGHLRVGEEAQPLCLIGDSGTGKSHLLIALGTEAAMAGFRVK